MRCDRKHLHLSHYVVIVPTPPIAIRAPLIKLIYTRGNRIVSSNSRYVVWFDRYPLKYLRNAIDPKGSPTSKRPQLQLEPLILDLFDAGNLFASSNLPNLPGWRVIVENISDFSLATTSAPPHKATSQTTISISFQVVSRSVNLLLQSILPYLH